MCEDIKEEEFDKKKFLREHRSTIFHELNNFNNQNEYNNFKDYLLNEREYDSLDDELTIYNELDNTSKAWLESDEEKKVDRIIEYNCISVDALHIHCKGKIVFYNCLIKSDIYIKSCDCSHIEFDSCMVLGKINVINSSKIYLRALVSNINCLDIFGVSNGIIELHGNRVLDLNMESIILKRCILSGNSIQYFKIIDYEILSKNYNDCKQFNLENIGRRAPDGFDTYKFCIQQRYVVDRKIKDENDCQQTIDALFDLTSIEYDKDKLSYIKFKKSLLGNNKMGKKIVNLTGGFHKPSLWFKYVIITIFGFGVIYSLPIIRFNNERVLNFWDALYLSFITFSTVGYGDISPIGIAKIFCAIEGIFGVGIMAGFVTTLASKYTD